MIKFAAGVTLAVVLLSVGIGVGYASRNASGTYTLATSAVTSNQTIGSALWNNTFNDVASSMTDSLDRNGRGGMLAALRGTNGTSAAPAYSFTSETTAGLYRAGAGDLRLALNSTDVVKWQAAGATFLQPILGNVSIAGAALSAPVSPYLSLMGGAAQFNLYMQDTRGATGNKVGRIIYDGSSAGGGTGNLSSPGWQFQNVDDTGVFVGTGPTLFRNGGAAFGSSGQLAISSAGALTVGASGTAVSRLNVGVCTLNGASPATCTATVGSGATCVATVAGVTPGSPAVQLVSTTLTITSTNGRTDNVNWVCF